MRNIVLFMTKPLEKVLLKYSVWFAVYFCLSFPYPSSNQLILCADRRLLRGTSCAEYKSNLRDVNCWSKMKSSVWNTGFVYAKYLSPVLPIQQIDII